jgi:hypothetical protein
MPRILRSLADLSDIRTLFEYVGFAPCYDNWLENDTTADLIVAIAAYELDKCDGTGECPEAKKIAAKAKKAGSSAEGAKVFALALDVPYGQALGLIDGWGDLAREIDNADELPAALRALVNTSHYFDYKDLGEMLRKEMKVISICRYSDQLGLTEAEVRSIAGVSSRTDVASKEDAIVHMLQEGHDEVYIIQRISHQAYRKGGGVLDFSDWANQST